jgi:hypothetical protein
MQSLRVQARCLKMPCSTGKCEEMRLRIKNMRGKTCCREYLIGKPAELAGFYGTGRHLENI